MYFIVTMLSPDAAARRFAVLQVLVSLVVSSSFVSADHSNGFEGDRKGVTSKLVPAVLVFGDSTVDPGNNEFYPTIARGNFPPYGVDFPQGIPTGRFSNGRLAPDFIASYLGVKDAIPPYLDPSLSIDDLVTGVSFASAASGYDPHTPTVLHVISMSEQLRYFSEYKTRLEQSIGTERTQETIDKAIYIVSSGTNDFLFQFATSGLSLNNVPKYDVSTYQRLIVDLCKQFIQVLFLLS
ncbi:GDSL esterase/lipase-like protein, partial [Drosera capensis]